MTSLFRSLLARQQLAYEQHFGWALMGIEQRHGIFLQTHLIEDLDEEGSVGWLREVDDAAVQVRRTGTTRTI